MSSLPKQGPNSAAPLSTSLTYFTLAV
jgi:hypothetical protein